MYIAILCKVLTPLRSPKLGYSWSWTCCGHASSTYFHTSKGHVTRIIKKVNRIPTHCGVAYESVRSLARGHMIRVCHRNTHFPPGLGPSPSSYGGWRLLHINCCFIVSYISHFLPATHLLSGSFLKFLFVNQKCLPTLSIQISVVM